MNKSSIDNFLIDINNIKEYINHIQMVNSIPKENKHISSNSLISFREHITSFNTKKKLFEYKSITISLYGILENYIELWIKEHIDNISTLILDYNDISDKVSQSHFDLSIKLISIISENRYTKYEHLNKEEVLTKLNSCINQPLNYNLNNEAFIITSGNLKHKKIIDLFKPLNIDLNEQIYKKINQIEAKQLFTIIDDLVVRRNDVSHGVNTDDILNLLEFDVYIDNLKKYATLIFNTLIEKEVEYELNSSFQKIENIYKVINKSILLFELDNNTIQKGDSIIIKADNNSLFKKSIIDIQINSQSIDKIIGMGRQNIGINLGNGLKENQTFYIKKRGNNV